MQLNRLSSIYGLVPLKRLMRDFVAQLYRATNLPRQLSIFHWQTVAQQTWLLVT